VWRGWAAAIGVRLAPLRPESVRGGDDEDVMWEERGLRRAAEAEHRKAMIARDEADGEDAAGECARASSRAAGVDLVGRALSERLMRALPVEPGSEAEQIPLDRPERPVEEEAARVLLLQASPEAVDER